MFARVQGFSSHFDMKGSRSEEGYSLQSRMLEEVTKGFVAAFASIDFLELLQAFLAKVTNCHNCAVGMAMQKESRTKSSANYSYLHGSDRRSWPHDYISTIQRGSQRRYTGNQRGGEAGVL